MRCNRSNENYSCFPQQKYESVSRLYYISALLIIVSVCVCVDILCSRSTWTNAKHIANDYNFESAHFSVSIKPLRLRFVLAHFVKNKTIIQYYSNSMAIFLLVYCSANNFIYIPLKITCRFLNTINHFLLLLLANTEEKSFAACELWI